MPKKDSEIVNSLIVGGIIGAALGGLLSKSKGAGALLGAIGGAAILSSWKATEAAKKTNIPLVLEEDGALYEIHSDGTKTFLEALPKANKILPKRFELK